MIRRLIIYGLLGLPLLMDACRNPLEGVQLRIKDPLQQSVVTLRFADPAGNPLPKNSRVRIVGPDADRVVTTLNTKNYKINADGNLLVAASPLVTPSDQQPFRFTVVVEADGYLTVVQPVVLTSTHPQTYAVRQISLTQPPRTLAATRAAGRAGADGTVPTALALTTAGQTGETDPATVTLPVGTKLTDQLGQPVGGNLTMAVLHTNARTGEANSQVPGRGVLSNVTGLDNGPALGNLRTTSVAGSVTIELYNEAFQLVKNLSQPVTWTMDISPTTLNGQTGRTVQAGDPIPLFSYDALTNRWQQEKPGVVFQNAQGRLTYRAEAAHLAAYVAAWTEPICEVGPVFRVSSKLTNVDVNYLCKLVDATTGATVGTFYANVNTGSLIRVYHQSPGRRLKLRVYDETDAWGKGVKGGLVAESAAGNTCDQTPVPVSLDELPVPPVMQLGFTFSCPGGTKLDEAALPAEMRTQYSEAGKEDWRDLITATRTERKKTSYKLQLGRTYDLRASTDGGNTWPLRQNDYLIDKRDWTLKIRAPMYCQ